MIRPVIAEATEKSGPYHGTRVEAPAREHRRDHRRACVQPPRAELGGRARAGPLGDHVAQGGAEPDGLVEVRREALGAAERGRRRLVEVREVAHLVRHRPARRGRRRRPRARARPADRAEQRGGLVGQVRREHVEVRRAHRPCHLGGRFSAKARGPSWASALR